LRAIPVEAIAATVAAEEATMQAVIDSRFFRYVN
jgi:hypothetical protein